MSELGPIQNSIDSGLVENLKKQNARLEEGYELLLLQLHQVQEELERYYLLSQQNEKRLNELAELEKSTPITRQSQIVKQFYKVTDRLGITIENKANIIRASGLFDERWYLQQYPDVAKTGMDPAKHYLRCGAKEGKNPSLQFETKWYCESYPDVANSKMNPLLHYIKFGKKEGRRPRGGGIQKTTEASNSLVASFAFERKQLVRARDEQAKLAAEQQAQLEQAAKRQEEQSRLVERLTKARDEQIKLAAEQQAQLEQAAKRQEGQSRLVERLTKARDEQAKLAAEQQQELRDTKQTASLSVKLQALREADLKDLQIRYQASLSKQEEQYQLLAKLSERLGVASCYFHQMANSGEVSSSGAEE